MEADVKAKLIKLLAIEEDFERENRLKNVENDTFSLVAMDILNEQREVTVAKPSGQHNVASSDIKFSTHQSSGFDNTQSEYNSNSNGHFMDNNNFGFSAGNHLNGNSFGFNSGGNNVFGANSGLNFNMNNFENNMNNFGNNLNKFMNGLNDMMSQLNQW